MNKRTGFESCVLENSPLFVAAADLPLRLSTYVLRGDMPILQLSNIKFITNTDNVFLRLQTQLGLERCIIHFHSLAPSWHCPDQWISDIFVGCHSKSKLWLSWLDTISDFVWHIILISALLQKLLVFTCLLPAGIFCIFTLCVYQWIYIDIFLPYYITFLWVKIHTWTFVLEQQYSFHKNQNYNMWYIQIVVSLNYWMKLKYVTKHHKSEPLYCL